MKVPYEEVTDLTFLSKSNSQTLCAGAELDVFDPLRRDAIRAVSDVAAESGLDPVLLYRLLRALASLGLLNEMPGRHSPAKLVLQRAAFGVAIAELAELESQLSRAG
jgi:DNA-binding IclR family transcriptional regulator